MNSLKLRETMNEVHMSDERRAEMIMRIREKSDTRRRHAGNWKRAALALATLGLVIGAAIPIQAGIRYLVEDRMKQIPQQEIEGVNDMLQAQEGVAADTFSRAYSSGERARDEKLRGEYEKGQFPQETLIRTDVSGKPSGDVLYYDAETGTFHLPGRAMTDEELLQIIDFQYTADYALEQSDAAKQAAEARAREEQRLRKAAEEKGLLTQEEAVEKAGEYLETVFGLSAEGTKVDVLMDERQNGTYVYHVYFGTEDDTTLFSYGIDVDAEDGSLAGTDSASLPKR